MKTIKLDDVEMSEIEKALKDMRDIWASVSHSQFGGCVLHPNNIDQINANFSEWMNRAEKAEAERDELKARVGKLELFKKYALEEFEEEWSHDEDRVMESFEKFKAERGLKF